MLAEGFAASSREMGRVILTAGGDDMKVDPKQ